MENGTKACLIESTARRIYNELCTYYNAQNIIVPMTLYNIIMRNVESAVQETSEVYLKELEEVYDNN